MRRIFIMISTTLFILILTGCGCKHEWQEANCTSPRTCALCQETEGEPLGHSWSAATCLLPETCSRCQETKGEPLGHSWLDATCTLPKRCENCTLTEGAATGHNWVEATCDLPETCTVCKETKGAPLGHTWAAATCTTPKACEVCSTTEGEAKGHNWQPATCTTAEACTVCHEAKGKALGHQWQEATTEAPKTCSRCKTTEGTKINTDSRFTTAATKHLHGRWSCDVVISAETLETVGYFDELKCTLYYNFHNDGKVTASMKAHNFDALEEALVKMNTDALYAEFQNSYGYDKEAANAAMKQTYGMTVEEYSKAYIDALNLEMIYNFTYEEVYYVRDNQIYIASSWNDSFEGSAYTLENGVLIIENAVWEEGGAPLQWKRA